MTALFNNDFERPSAREISAGARWLLGLTALMLVLAMLIASMGIFGWGWFQRSTADFRGETAALEQIYADPNTRITAYEHFFTLCASVQGHEDLIRALRSELDDDPSESRKEQLRGAITANQGQRDRKIRQYNVDADRGYTIGQFRDSRLPHKLDVDKEETTCVG